MGSSEFITPSLEYHSWYGSSHEFFITLKDILKSESYIRQCCSNSHFHDCTDPKEVPTKDVLGIRVLLDGSPGSGKTVLCYHYCKRWGEGSLLEAYFLVVYIALRDVSSASMIEDLLSYGKDSLRKAVAEELQATSGEGTLFILDGWDELQHELQHKQSLICKILLRKVLPKCSVLITSRPHSSAWLKQSKAVTRHVVITGFSKDQVKECIASEFHENPSEGGKFVSLLESRPDLVKLCNIPLNLAILMYIYKASNHTLPNTLTKIYQKFIINALHRHMSKRYLSTEIVEFHAISELPDHERELYKAMCKLSFDGLSNDELVFSKLCLKRYHSDLPENALGLMTTSKTFTDTGITSKYQFLHASVQEFLAAEELSTQTPDIQVKFLRQHLHEDRFRLTIIFFCGQAQISSELESIFRYPAPILGSYHFYQHWYEERQHQIRTFLLLMEMILESQNKELCLALSMNVHDMNLDFTHYTLSKHDYFVFANFLCFGGCKWRALNLNRCISESGALNLFFELLSKSPQTLQLENLTICPLGCDSDSINDLLNQPSIESLNVLKLQRPYAHSQMTVGIPILRPYCDISSLSLRHLHNLSSLTIGGVHSSDEFFKVIQLVLTLKSLNSLHLFPDGDVCIQELDWSQDSVITKAFSKWLPQCKILQIEQHSLHRSEYGCSSEFLLYSISSSLFRNMQTLQLHCHLNSEQAHQLFIYLHNSRIIELNLSRNHHMFMSPEAARKNLKRFFPIERQAQFKKIKLNHIDAAEALNSFLKSTQTLVVLDLSGCGIDGVTMNIIANEISLCRTLAQFHVGRSKISGSGMSALCSALASGHKPKMVLPNQSPMKLFLQHCDLNDKDASKLAQLLQNSSRIAGLDLSSNDLSASGVSAIMSAVSNGSVKTINLSYNDWYLGGGDATKLSQSFEKALSPSSELEELLIEYTTKLYPLATRGIALGLVRNSSLTCLKISDINAVTLVDIFNAVTGNGTLQELHVHVQRLELGIFIIDLICSMLQNNKTLTTLRIGELSFHQHQCQDLLKVFQALRQNFTVTKLTLAFVWMEDKKDQDAIDIEKLAMKEGDLVNLVRAKEKKPYVVIRFLVNTFFRC